MKNTLKLVGDVKGTLTFEVSVNIGIDNTALAMSKMGYGQPSYIPKLYWYYIIDSKENKISPLRYKNWSDGIDKNNMTFGYIDGEAP